MHAQQVIATHVNTDFDAFASMLAARRLYPNAAVALSGSLNRNVRELYRLHADELGVVEASTIELDSVRTLIVVETLSAARLGELEPLALDPEVEKIAFDHHGAERPEWIDADKALISTDGALTTTLVGVLAERELPVTPLEATVFALGIHEDTGSLTYASATQRDADALAWCLRHGARQELIARYLHTPLGETERGLLTTLLDRLETREVAGVEVIVATAVWPHYVEGLSNLAHKLVDLTDCRALVVLVEMGERVFCVVRSRIETIDASQVAEALGGGGHAEAASAIVRGTLEEARALLPASLEGAVHEPLRAASVMSRPARAIGPDESVARAMILCQRYRQSGIFVAEGDRLVGEVGREDLDKAIGHGLPHAPVKGIMSSQVLTCDEETALPELGRLVERSDTGRVAVVRDGALVGVVSRRDLLRALGSTQPEAEDPVPTLAAELDQVERLRAPFEAVAALSEHEQGVYLVGGTVRDILLGEPSFDVDIAVEGDAVALARSLAEALRGRVRAHPKFGTAVVLYGQDERIDVVTARTEFYEAPAALPTVEHASIREDLFRRDFTINAMAVSLKGADFGRLVDPFGGRRDLETRTIRVLHNLSFIDDPTRIFRAVRYESRQGFRMDDHTLRLSRACIEMGLVGDLSSARVRDELKALLEEGEVAHSISRLGELGADRAVHPHLAADEKAVRLLERLRALRDEYELEIPRWRLGLIALARDLPPDELYGWLRRLKIQRRDVEQIAGAITVGPRILERLSTEDLSPAELVALLEPYAPDAPLLALAVEELRPLRAYFAELRDVRLEVGGGDLARMGVSESPRVGEILAELRRRKLNGELRGRDSELAAARELVAQLDD